MPNRKDLKKYLVWNNPETKMERYIIHINDDGSCVCVGCNFENYFLEGHSFGTTLWLNWEEIPEKKMRSMTRNEVLRFVVENSNKILVRNNGGKWHFTFNFSYEDKTENYEYIYIDELDNDEQPKKFEIEE